MTYQTDIRALTQQLRDIVATAQADRCDYGSDLPRYRDSMTRIMETDLVPIEDVANQIDAALASAGKPAAAAPPAPAPEPEPADPDADPADPDADPVADPLPVHEDDATAPMGISRTKLLPTPVADLPDLGGYVDPEAEDEEEDDDEDDGPADAPRRPRGRPRKVR